MPKEPLKQKETCSVSATKRPHSSNIQLGSILYWSSAFLFLFPCLLRIRNKGKLVSKRDLMKVKKQPIQQPRFPISVRNNRKRMRRDVRRKKQKLMFRLQASGRNWLLTKCKCKSAKRLTVQNKVTRSISQKRWPLCGGKRNTVRRSRQERENRSEAVKTNGTAVCSHLCYMPPSRLE